MCVHTGHQWPSWLGQVFSSGARKPVVCYWICRQDHKGVVYELWYKKNLNTVGSDLKKQNMFMLKTSVYTVYLFWVLCGYRHVVDKEVPYHW